MIVMNDFKKEYAYYKTEMDVAIQSTLESGWYILGSQGKVFEEIFAEYIGTKYAIGVANGLEAMQISLMALGVGKGDEVITVSNSAVATALAITNAGATPVFVDVDDFYHIDLEELEEAITPKTKAIIPVHLFGQCVDMEALNAIAKKHNLFVIEDACQAAGASYAGKKTGSWGTVGCFSFYPTKNLGGYGEKMFAAEKLWSNRSLSS
jgi:dTDP-4-amino-4,6-dideoxygalactose transaminase